MGESERATITPEDTKSFIWVKTADGSIQQVEEDVVSYCFLRCADRNNGASAGSSRNFPISLPPAVSEASLNAILDFCRFHLVPGRSKKERKSFNGKFAKMDTERLKELLSAADALKIAPLVNLASIALARNIGEKSPEEVREIFNLPDDLTEEEKLGPLKESGELRIRLLNRLNAKKLKELKEKNLLKNAEAEESADVDGDKRSIDDLLSFINGEDEDDKCTKTKKKKKRTRRMKDPPKDNSSDGLKITDEKEVACNRNGDPSSTNPSTSSMLQDFANIELNDDDAYSDLDLDPEEKENLDREVKEFRKKLNDDWLSKGKQPKLIPNISPGFFRSVQD